MADGQSTYSNLDNSSNPEALDRVIKTTSSRLWVALIGFIVVLLALVFWAFSAEIPVSVTVHGVVEMPGGRMVIPAPAEGSVETKFLEQDAVTKGEVVAVLRPFDGSAPIAIMSPIDGVVSDVEVMNGAGVAKGATIGAISGVPRGDTGRVVAYVGPANLPTFEVGRSVQVQLGVDSASAPTMEGTVASISAVPATIADMQATLIPEAAALMMAKETYGLLYPVVIDLESSDTSGQLVEGQVVTVVNTYESVRPIDAITSGAQ